MSNTQEQTTFYIRKPNGRYCAVKEWDAELMSAFPMGHTLVTVAKNPFSQVRRTLREPVTADHVALAAAAEELNDQLAKIVMDAGCLRPSTTLPLTPQQQDLWDQLLATGIHTVFYPAVADVAQEILDVIVKKAAPVSDVPWVQEARDRYRAALALAHQEQEQ